MPMICNLPVLLGKPIYAFKKVSPYGLWFNQTPNSRKSSWHLYKHTQFGYNIKTTPNHNTTDAVYSYKILEKTYVSECGIVVKDTARLRYLGASIYTRKKEICPKCRKIALQRLRDIGQDSPPEKYEQIDKESAMDAKLRAKGEVPWYDM